MERCLRGRVMNLKELKKFVRVIMERAVAHLRADGELSPKAYLVTPDDMVLLLGLIFGNDTEKERAKTAFKNLARRKRAIAAFIAIEAWMAPSNEGIRARDNPSRKSCLLVTGSSGPGGKYVAMIQPFELQGHNVILGKKEIYESANRNSHDFFLDGIWEA